MAITISIRGREPKVALVDPEDYEELARFSWYIAGRGYARRRDGGTGKNGIVYMHRQLLGAPVGMEVDHINGDRLGNRRCNLRLCDSSQNKANIRKRAGTTSRFRGVSWSRHYRCWCAYIRVRGHHRKIGNFQDEEAAARAYDREALAAWGEFARPNFPQGEK